MRSKEEYFRNKIRFATVLCLIILPFFVKGQEVIQNAGAISLPALDGGSKIINSGQTLTVTSNTSVSLRPGFYAAAGSTVSISILSTAIYPVPLANNNTNPELNWIINKEFDEIGNVVSASKKFFDLGGKLLQSQSINTTTGHVLASQTLNDRYGRQAIQTLVAPVNSSDFIYRSNFVSGSNGQSYTTSLWDLPAKLNSPDAVDSGTIGTLGWYYSDNNTWDAYVPATAYPYSRNDYFKDGTETVSRTTGPGEQLKMGTGHESVGNNFPVINELSNYLAIRNRFFTDAGSIGATGQTDLIGSAVQSIGKDAQGNWVMNIKDKDGKLLMNALPGNWFTVNNTVTLNNYKEEYDINGATLGTQLTDLKLTGAGTFFVYNNNSLVYQGNLAGYTIPGTIATTEKYRFLSDRPFTVQYASVTGVSSKSPVCENCHSQVQDGNVNGQDYHYFALPAGGNVNITGGNVQIEDVVNNSVLYTNQTGAVTLAAGMYKAIAQSSQPQLSYSTSWGDISYNFYDQKGQAIASIAPNGVQQIISNGVSSYADLAHLPFTSTVEYNQQGKVMAFTLADGGRTEFVYRKDGKMRLSQNAEQRKNGRFTYANYDDSGRSVESGEYLPGDITFENAKINQALIENINPDGGLTNGIKKDWVRVHYDQADNSHGQSGYVQDYLDGVISWTENSNAKTWYSYNEQGKLTWVVKYVNGLGYKTFDYNYNFLGKVTTVSYQKNNPAESFYHYYTYDTDQRLSNVQTSRDGVNKLQQAGYQYYLHGPIKRVELGDQLQGLDYVYTAQGKLKSINSASGDPAKDPGHDGQNSFTPDAFSMQLEYFNGDYSRTGTNIGSVNSVQNYYNGNVNAFGWQSKKPQGVVSISGIAIQNPTMYNYSYDNKSQLTGAAWGTPDYTALSFTPQTKFSENNISYDANGNLKGLQRTSSSGTLADDFSNYQYQSGTNKLNSVGNANNSTVYANYTYNSLGQLASETQTGSNYYINYNVNGKITGIYADASLTQLKIGYAYDESGNRISMTDNTGTTPVTTYYVYNTAGNSAAIYTGTTLTEMSVYGSSRLGTYTLAANAYAYELRDNVGSVRVVINRNRDSQGKLDVMRYNDYYPYGSVAQSGGTNYRYDYQGAYAEKDPVTGFNNFALRMYDPRIGRWLSVDPMGQHNSPYAGMGNNPVSRFDKNGGYDDYPDEGTAALAWVGAYMNGKTPGSIYNTGGKNGWGFNIVSAKNPEGVTFQNNGGLDLADQVWNGPIARAMVPDVMNASVSGSMVAGIGLGGSFNLTLLTRGKDIGFHRNNTGSLRVGAEAGVSANYSAGYFLGDPHNATYDSLLGSGVDGTVSLAVGVGAWGSLKDNLAPSWLGYTVGFGPGAGGSVGFTMTEDGW
ncbi:RHS repeat domain-containing protein [Pedobacter cryoconitis]|uniref:RHS repeat-associated protein n=1 Tax=Pedobacter cryoconitis TaxID=188932 RepID=A0A7X0MJ83_9SPHI|nr:RHS repeat-associated core domain-containing protein [Pedobacter cryoconitis]MBB6499355.1 RHS repeat-associated protein [Pedobacter cryoconitis]